MKYFDPKNFQAIDHGDGYIIIQADSSYEGKPFPVCPIGIHHKSDGAINDGASFCFAFDIFFEDENSQEKKFMGYGGISFDTLQKAFDELGYELKKK